MSLAVKCPCCGRCDPPIEPQPPRSISRERVREVGVRSGFLIEMSDRTFHNEDRFVRALRELGLTVEDKP